MLRWVRIGVRCGGARQPAATPKWSVGRRRRLNASIPMVAKMSVYSVIARESPTGGIVRSKHFGSTRQAHPECRLRSPHRSPRRTPADEVNGRETYGLTSLVSAAGSSPLVHPMSQQDILVLIPLLVIRIFVRARVGVRATWLAVTRRPVRGNRGLALTWGLPKSACLLTCTIGALGRLSMIVRVSLVCLT
jgi:hypothetical protein